MILIDGYHLLCESSDNSSTQDFGDLQSRLEAEGVQVLFFGTCLFPGRPSIEELGQDLGQQIQTLNAPQVDLISHSMGGLIVRAYLSGKQNMSGVFQPPANTKVRKWISIATPNFGALIPPEIADYLPDVEAKEMVPGSQFLFDLATWNQNHDDLRGVDALGLVGNAGGAGPLQGTSDGTVAVTSASLVFARPPERTRVLPYCHGSGGLTSILGLGCSGPPIAHLENDNWMSWTAIDSFLSGSDGWQNVGHTPDQDSVLSHFGGQLTQNRDAEDRPTQSPQDQTFVLNPPVTGGYMVIINKAGPEIALAIPSPALLPKLSLAPRMWISIYGSNLGASTVLLNSETLRLNYNDANQINALLPEDVLGLAKLTIENSQGLQTINVWIEPVVPAIFAALSNTGTASGTASIYLTGMGVSNPTPTVTVNGAPATVLFSGRAPGYLGLDQINIALPAGVSSGDVVVTAGGNASNAAALQ